MEAEGDGTAQPLLRTPEREDHARFSPDGKFIVFRSDSGDSEPEVMIRRYPAVDEGLWQVSVGGGNQPFWSRNGREVFYWTNSRPASLMSVPVDTTAAVPRIGNPRKLFSLGADGLLQRIGGVTSDGRFLMVQTDASAGQSDGQSSVPTIGVIENWLEEFRQR